MGKSSSKKLTNRVRQAILESALVPEQFRKLDFAYLKSRDEADAYKAKGWTIEALPGTPKRWRATKVSTRDGYEVINPALIDSDKPQTLVPCRKNWAIERYYRRGLIDERQYDAGVKFRELSERAAIQPRVTGGYQQSYQPKGGGRRIGEMSDRVADARKEWNMVLKGLPPRIADIAVDAICFDEPPARFGRGAQPEKVGMAYIRLCLDVLADHYRL